MLRLWPETVHAGLFADSAWLSGGRGRAALQRRPSAGDADSLLLELQAMLALLPKAGGRRHLQLLVSDSLAAITMLPWQDQLQGQAELEAYAQACFERNGLALDGTWTMHAAFRHFRGGGMAYALPHAWLSAVVAACESHQVSLKSVLPVSAASYWRLSRQRVSGPGLVLLTEAQRVTALAYQDGSLALVDVQPVTGDAASAGTRLLRRIAARIPAVAEVRHWSSAGADAAPGFIGAHLPGAAILQLPQTAWNR